MFYRCNDNEYSGLTEMHFRFRATVTTLLPMGACSSFRGCISFAEIL